MAKSKLKLTEVLQLLNEESSDELAVVAEPDPHNLIQLADVPEPFPQHSKSVPEYSTQPAQIVAGHSQQPVAVVQPSKQLMITSEAEQFAQYSNQLAVVSEPEPQHVEGVIVAETLEPLGLNEESVVELRVEDGILNIAAVEVLTTDRVVNLQPLQDKSEDSPKKRKCAKPDQWKRNILKKRRTSGQGYQNYKNKVVSEKKLVPKHCRKNCFEILGDETKKIFDAFYSLASRKIQDHYLFGLVEQSTGKKQNKTTGKRDRCCPFKYFVKRGNGERIEVCARCFLLIHAVDRSRIRHLLGGEDQLSPNPDRRGKHTPKNKTSDETIVKIKQHIKSCGPKKSHYSPRDNPNMKYLPHNLNIKRMWKSYVKEREPDAWEDYLKSGKFKGEVSERKYRTVFNTYSLSFGYPRTDTCCTCDLLNSKIAATEDFEGKQALLDEKDAHLLLADKGYQQMKDDGIQARLSQENPGDLTDMYSFDYQQNFMIPNMTHSEMYYSRQLNVYNFGVHDHVTRDGIMFLYTETVAKKGGAEVSSCLKKLLDQRDTGAKRCIFYSDGCGGQNRNHDVVCFMQSLIHKKRYQSIDHKILVRGHTRLANDRDFGLIKQRCEVENIFTPDDYAEVIRSARESPRPFSVVKMTSNDFWDYRKLSQRSIKMQFKDQNKTNVSFSKIRWFSYGSSLEVDWESGIEVERKHPCEVWCRYTLDSRETWKKVELLKRGSFEHHVELKYTGPIELSSQKWKDISKQIPYIPDLEKRRYFQSLPHQQDQDVSDESEFCDDSDN